MAGFFLTRTPTSSVCIKSYQNGEHYGAAKLSWRTWVDLAIGCIGDYFGMNSRLDIDESKMMAKPPLSPLDTDPQAVSHGFF